MPCIEAHGRHSVKICLLNRRRRGWLKTGCWQSLKFSKEEESCFRYYQPVNLTLMIGTIPDWIVEQLAFEAVERKLGSLGPRMGSPRTGHVESTVLTFMITLLCCYSSLEHEVHATQQGSWKIFYKTPTVNRVKHGLDGWTDWFVTGCLYVILY